MSLVHHILCVSHHNHFWKKERGIKEAHTYTATLKKTHREREREKLWKEKKRYLDTWHKRHKLNKKIKKIKKNKKLFFSLLLFVSCCVSLFRTGAAGAVTSGLETHDNSSSSSRYNKVFLSFLFYFLFFYFFIFIFATFT